LYCMRSCGALLESLRMHVFLLPTDIQWVDEEELRVRTKLTQV
jgi:hypothetical protein